MIGLFAMTVPAFAAGPAGAVQLAFHENSQTAALPAGRISLRVIDRGGADAQGADHVAHHDLRA